MDAYNGKYCLVRSRDAGVYAGTVVGIKGAVVRLTNARRIWYWAGAATLSELATRGTYKPGACKWPAAVPEVLVRGWCEVLPVSGEAMATYACVPVWSE